MCTSRPSVKIKKLVGRRTTPCPPSRTPPIQANHKAIKFILPGYTVWMENHLLSTPLPTVKLCRDSPLVFPTPRLGGNRGGSIFLLFLVLISITMVLGGWNPKVRLSVIKGCVLMGEINALTLAAGLVAAALGESAGTLGELGADSSILLNPVCKGVFAILDDTVYPN